MCNASTRTSARASGCGHTHVHKAEFNNVAAVDEKAAETLKAIPEAEATQKHIVDVITKDIDTSGEDAKHHIEAFTEQLNALIQEVGKLPKRKPPEGQGPEPAPAAQPQQSMAVDSDIEIERVRKRAAEQGLDPTAVNKFMEILAEEVPGKKPRL